MNNIQALTESILKQAQAETEQYLNAEREKIAQERDSSEKALTASYEEKRRQLEVLSAERIKMVDTRKRSMLQKERTRYKQSLLDRVFEEAYGELCDMSTRDFLDYYKSVVLTAKLSGSFTVRVGERSAKSLSEADWTELNVKTDGCEITADRQTIAGEGGFVLSRSSMEYSFLFRDQLQEIKHSDGSGILKQLLD